MTIASGVLVLCITQMGWSSSYLVSSSPGAQRSFPTFNDNAKDERATIVFLDGSTVNVQDVMAAPDSTSFLNVTTGLRSVVPTHAIEKIVCTNRLVGFLEASGIGLLGGAGTGSLVAAIAGGGNAFVVVGLIITGVGAGGLVGGVTGLILGHTYEYNFVSESEKP